MEPNMAREEAERWLGTSAKLLNGRDLIGSKTFAIRARDADPSNPIADQILAVVDTLIAAEKRVINATSYDWYSILQLPQFARDPDEIAAQYNRLVLLLNPEHNGLPYSDFALRLVVDAWSTLSDPAKKWMFDSELSLSVQLNSTQATSPSFPVDLVPELTRVDSTSPFQFFQQPPQPQPQQCQAQSQPQRQNRAREQQFPPQPDPQPLQEANGRARNSDEGRVNDHNIGEDGGNANVNDDDCNDDDDVGGVDDEIESFWTTCPYCYYTYEYPKTFQDCTLRCQNCRRAFHALQIPNPPPVTRRGKETTFCCWGYFPLGFSMKTWKKNIPFGGNATGLGSNSMPFSPMFGSPSVGVKKNVVRKPVVYLDDDDDFDAPYSSDDSDSSFDWNSTKKSKKRKSVKSGVRRGRVGRKSNAEKERERMMNQTSDDKNPPQAVDEMQGITSHYVVIGLKSDVNNKAGGSGSTRNQTGKGVRGRKKLDLNVEFSNEVEEHAPTISAGNGEEEVGFFEGLDEFLSTLPILDVVGDDKAKPS